MTEKTNGTICPMNLTGKLHHFAVLLAVFLAVCLAFVLPASAVDVWDGNTITAVTPNDDTYLIRTGAELAWIAEQANLDNSQNDFTGKTVKLADDIDLGWYQWTPIGLHFGGSYNKAFSGTFDGDGHTISHLNVTGRAPDYESAGLFGFVNNGVVKNVNIIGAVVNYTTYSNGGSSDNGIAVLVGSATYGDTIENVFIKDAVVEGNRRVGGVIGYAAGSLVNCHVENITLKAIPDTENGLDNGDKIGGIAGYVQDPASTISQCSAKEVKILAYRDAGGIVGYMNGGAIDQCIVNDVAITIDQSGPYESMGPNSPDAGPIAGESSGTIADSVYNYVTLTIKTNSGTTVTKEGTKYLVTIQPSIHGTVTADKSEEMAGETVTLTVTPDEGYKLESISAKTESHESVPISKNTFIMKADKVTVTAVFTKIPETPISQPSSGNSGSSVWLTETPTPTPTVTPTPSETVPPDIPITPPTEPESPGFGLIAVLAGLGIVAVLRRR